MIERHRFGTAYFRFSGQPSSFYSIYLVVWGLGSFVGLVFGLVLGLIFAVNGQGHPGASQPGFSLNGMVFYALLLPFIFLIRQYLYARLFNAVWNATRLDESRFTAVLEVGAWIRLQTVNWLAIIFSCGFLYPWAAIRSARHLASCLRFHPAPGFFALGRVEGTAGSAVGEMAAELFGLDFGL